MTKLYEQNRCGGQGGQMTQPPMPDQVWTCPTTLEQPNLPCGTLNDILATTVSSTRSTKAQPLPPGLRTQDLSLAETGR